MEEFLRQLQVSERVIHLYMYIYMCAYIYVYVCVYVEDADWLIVKLAMADLAPSPICVCMCV